MRRSQSYSHIPIPNKPDGPEARARKRSRSGIRTSTKNIPQSAGKVRAGSCEKLAVPGFSRSSSSLAFNSKKSVTATPTLGAAKNFGKKSTGLTPTLGTCGFQRSSNVTPSFGRSRSRSPYKIRSERSVNDKKWVSQQFAKVRKYLHEHISCPEHIPEILKPPTINSFIFVMNLLLKEIDPHLEINNANYKEVVLNTLKTLHYPGNISNSLLKTVNTMHAWPQVVSIFAWLVDLITTINRVEHPASPSQEQDPQFRKTECVTNYIIERYLRYNNNEEHEDANRALVEDFGKILNIDEGEMKRVEEEVTHLSQLKEKQMKSIAEQKNKNDEIQNQIDRLESEMNSFYLNKEEKSEDIDYALAALKERKSKLVEAVKAKKANIAKLAEAIKVQPCTVKEKKRMLKHIEEMKHTIDLKKEKLKAQKCIKNNCDLKLTEAKKKVETEVYRWNNNLRKLTLLEPDLKILHLKETDFLSAEFEKDVRLLDENIKKFGSKFSTEIGHMKSSVSKLKTEISALQHQIESLRKTVQTLTESESSTETKIEMCNKEMETMFKKREEQKRFFSQKMSELKSAEADLSQVQNRLREVTELKNKKEAHLESLKVQSLDFFAKVHENVMNNLVEMNNVRTDVFKTIETSLNQININQNAIVENLQKLEELQD